MLFKKWLAPLFAGCCLIACHGIIETDISGDQVRLLTPQDSTVTYSLQQNFRWEELSDASFYLLQIASPHFDAPDRYWLDTTIAADNFTFTLPSNLSLEWRVKGMNGSSETGFSSRMIFTDTSFAIEHVVPQLFLPPNPWVSKEVVQSFSWDSIPGAVDYIFELRNAAGNMEPIQGYSLITTDLHIDSLVLPEGKFHWCIQGRDNSNLTQKSCHSIEIDTTAPGRPKLVSPASGDTLSGTVDFSWLNQESMGSVETSVLEIYQGDSLGSPVERFDEIQGESYALDSLAAGTYHWRIQVEDEAGNAGDFSFFTTFYIE